MHRVNYEQSTNHRAKLMILKNKRFRSRAPRLPAEIGSCVTDADSLSGIAAYRPATRTICFATHSISVTSNLNAIRGVQSLNSPIIRCDSRCFERSHGADLLRHEYSKPVKNADSVIFSVFYDCSHSQDGQRPHEHYRRYQWR